MFKITPFKQLSSFFLMLCLGILGGCNGSDFQDTFSRCAPACSTVESSVPLDDYLDAFIKVTDTIDVETDTLNGRWVMFSTVRFSYLSNEQRSRTDALFTKSFVIDESDDGKEVTISDCHVTETYSLSDSGFSIPKESEFFSLLNLENRKVTVVEKSSNILLKANWEFTTPFDTQEIAEVMMVKVNNDNSTTAPVGQINSTDNIFCYSYLNLYSAGEQFFDGQWVPIGTNETQEMFLGIDPASGDKNIALSSEKVNGKINHFQYFNKGISGEEYQCYGENSLNNTTNDHLSFHGFFNITVNDVECSAGGRMVSDNSFVFFAD